MTVADVAARDARGRRRRADERAADRVKARRRLLERLASRTSNAEIEFREWAELCRDDDQNDLRERRLDEAKLCGDVYGELKFLNAPVDPVDVTSSRGTTTIKETTVGSRRGGTRRSACAASRRCGMQER